jgi:uncharacterized cupin superfamily protein
MTKIHNIDTVPAEFTDDPELISAMSTRYLGALAGSERIYVNVDYVKPGGKSVKYHSHSHQEEFFLVLRGSGTLRIQDQHLAVKQGDFIAKPAGKGIAHQFINDGEGVLEILDCGVPAPDDVIDYPDENIRYVKAEGRVLRDDVEIQDWSSDPNEA